MKRRTADPEQKWNGRDEIECPGRVIISRYISSSYLLTLPPPKKKGPGESQYSVGMLKNALKAVSVVRPGKIPPIMGKGNTHRLMSSGQPSQRKVMYWEFQV